MPLGIISRNNQYEFYGVVADYNELPINQDGYKVVFI